MDQYLRCKFCPQCMRFDAGASLRQYIGAGLPTSYSHVHSFI
jgi:hypothetical protein